MASCTITSRDGVFNFVVEIPKESSAKMEVATHEPFTSIKQDTTLFGTMDCLQKLGKIHCWRTLNVDGAFGDKDPVDVV